ncbi:MAG: hypothetical protein LIO96_12955, partial [Lachnospiraceae bacterium]|nr:hypothetical protein [Lachnospiraceae bacterium]
ISFIVDSNEPFFNITFPFSSYFIEKSLNKIHFNKKFFGPKTDHDEYIPLTALVQACPPQQLKHLEQIISQYFQTVQKKE